MHQAELSQLFTSQSGTATAAELQRLFSLPRLSLADCHVAESAMSTGAQLGPGSNPLPALSESNTPGAPHSAAPSLRSDAGGKQGLQLVYVFTTHLANT